MLFDPKNKSNLFLALLVGVAFIGGLIFSYQATLPIDHAEVSKEFSFNLDHQLKELDRYASEYISQRSQPTPLTLEQVGLIDFFTVTNLEIDQWTSNQFLPGVRFVLGDFHVKHIKSGAGDFLLRKWVISEGKFLMAIVPLHIHYKIQNEYLEPQWNKTIFSDYEVQIFDASGSQGFGVTFAEKTVFRCAIVPDYVSDFSSGFASTILFSIALVLVLLILFRFYASIQNRYPIGSFIFLSGCIVVIRYGMVIAQFPARFVDTELFDPKYFASSFFNPSLGDHILNLIALTVLCFILIQSFRRSTDFQHSTRAVYLKWLTSIFSVIAILFGALFPFVVIQTIYNNSGITLNISQSIYFDSLRIVAFASLVLSWISSFLFMHVFIRILSSKASMLRIGLSLLIGSVIFVLVNEWSGQFYISSLLIGVGYTLLVITFTWYKSLQQFHYLTFVYFFLAVLAHSLNGLVAITHFSNSQKIYDQTRFANAFLIDRDDFGEFLLDEAIQKISADLFVQSRISGPFMNKEAVRQKVRQIFIPRYFNKYNIDVHLFGPAGDPLDDHSSLKYEDWMESYTGLTATPYRSVFFISRPDFESTRKYIGLIPIKRGEINMGTIALEFSLKRIIPDNVYPDLLVDNRFQQAFRSQEFSYAVFINNKIQFRSGEFNYTAVYTSFLENSDLFDDGIIINQYRHIGSQDSSGRIVVVSSPVPATLFTLADFSFLLIIGLAAIMLYLFVVGLVGIVKHERLMMSARIQLILNISFFVPLIGVSIITVGLTAKSNQKQLNAEYLAKSRSFTNEISAILNEQTIAESGDYEQNFTQLSKLSNLDANLFSPAGKLQVASQPLLFENQLLAPYINPLALQRFQEGDRSFIADERVGNLNYFVAYSGVYSPNNGSLLGIAAIPFFQSAYLLEKMQITVLSNVLSLFTAIFIVLLFISYWVSRWLTFPLRMITQKLGGISLTHSNQPIEWQSDDEIGLMVREYNLMLSTLSESKKELERTQRERAWREIAKQVAHEIKNPLTPMKLTLQKLERLADGDPLRAEKLQKAIASILSQVDSLDEVATSFSAFAKMPEPVMNKVELIELVRNVIHLHNHAASITLTSDKESVAVRADEQLLSRILSNLLLNSIQASRPNFPQEINVSVKQMEHIVQIIVSDNGMGIEEALQESIFHPHFSTKHSGSGLGLAIAKQGIEQMGGRIYFESKAGEGATFYIELKNA